MIVISETFEKKHAGLAGRLAGALTSLFPVQPVTICDADEQHLAAAHRIIVRRAGHCQVLASGSQIQIIYDDPQSDFAFSALLAAMAKLSGSIATMADPQSLSVFALADRLARTDVPVLITGPTGTGKEVLSRFVHSRSTRADGNFVALNCAAIPETMLEAMLFGHQKGAFTGANCASPGFFREADGGTLLLDEIAEMPLPLQAKLLRALQEGEVVPVGSTKPVKVDARIIACANRDLPSEVAAGRFREDLFYRLNVFPLHLPSLYERPGDIAPLACAMLFRHGDILSQMTGFTPAALHKLSSHRWPGNVRELENVIRRALVLAHDKGAVGAEHIQFDNIVSLQAMDGHQQDMAYNASVAGVKPPATARIGEGQAAHHEMDETPTDQAGIERSQASNSQMGKGKKLSKIVQLSEARAILDTLKACGGKRVEAARRLGISERTLRYRLASYRDSGLDMGVAL